jgi:hypothetical protein
MSKWMRLCIYAVLVVVGVGVSVWLAFEGPSPSSWHAAPVIGSLLVAIAWIVTAQHTVQVRMRDHTIGVIRECQGDEAKHRRALIRKYLPQQHAVLELPGESPEYGSPDHEIYRAVDDQLDAFDRIALGVKYGLYDDAMLKGALKTTFRELHDLADRYIQYTQDSENDADIWRDFSGLSAKWSPTDDEAATADRNDAYTWLFASFLIGFVMIAWRWLA